MNFDISSQLKFKAIFRSLDVPLGEIIGNFLRNKMYVKNIQKMQSNEIWKTNFDQRMVHFKDLKFDIIFYPNNFYFE